MADASMKDPTESVSVTKRSRKDPSECKICGAPALYSYYSVIACPSCKVFFKRNAETKQEQLKCRYDDHCEINIYTRHTCTFCRLAKCFASGMQIQMIRSSRSGTSTNNRVKTTTTDSMTLTTNILVKRTERNEPQQLRTLNLLRADQSTLTTDQWNLLSNLIHCYDEHSRFSTAEHFIREQNNLPIKMRFKLGPTCELFASCIRGAQLLFKNNAHFNSLSSHDRSLLLHNTIKHVGRLGSSFVLHRTGLFDNPAFCKTGETIYGASVFNCSKRAIIQLDSDLVFPKLILTILIFSKPDYVHYTNNAPETLQDAKTILHFQEMYIELAWRYLVYKYDHHQAVLCFSNLIRCIFTLNHAVVAAIELQQYTDMIDSFVKQTEETMSISE